MDPPYNKGLWKPVINRLKEFNLIAEHGIIILEESKDVEIDQSKYTILADKEWGGTRVLFLRHK
jgi:16S rRNA (guanine966-N2)-methyltransferase